MSDGFIQLATGPTGTTTDSATLAGVTAGNTLVAFGWASASAPATHTISDAQGSYAIQAVTASDSLNNVWAGCFVLQNANAGSHTATVTFPAGTPAFIVLVEIQAPTSGAVLGENAAFQNAPGTGANALSSGSVPAASNATLLGMVADTASTATSDEPTTPLFTSRSNAANTVMGAYRMATGAIVSAAPFTGTAITGAHQFIAIAVAIANRAVAAINLMGAISL